ncbi:radical SAM family heme chaperone HemW [Veillonella montpellierensis]|uniref:radical SAM family heme chaperone HemW n=1 Tax=Veillonella montpellierensis TaxID=187328 RepID=UPI0023F96BED|nr:radical SAM family heme chaperone HemW [Veillonella montpellierensis]
MTALASNNRDMGIYLHIPFCRQKCTYCDFAAYQNLEDYYDAYVAALLDEVRIWCEMYPESTTIPVDTIYFGGGTPTELSIVQLEKILKTLDVYFPLQNVRQVSIEANPHNLTTSYLSDLYALGCNRISFGVQTFNDRLLHMIHRNHTGREAVDTIYQAYEAGFTNINLDLMYALPSQTLMDIENSVHTAMTLPIHHISIYGLQVEPTTQLSYAIKQGQLTLPEEEVEMAMYDYLVSTLPEVGFNRYEVANFAKEGYVSYHNLRYWHYKEYLGFGVGAHSFYNHYRRANHAYVIPYIKAVEQSVLPIKTEEYIDRQRDKEDYCFLHLRTTTGIYAPDFEDRFGLSLEEEYGVVIRGLMDKGLLTSKDNRYYMTDEGFVHGNYVFAQFIK